MPRRLFWSADERFTGQFTAGNLATKFKSFSKYPPVFKDMAFWVSDGFTENNLAEIVRGAGAPRRLPPPLDICCFFFVLLLL